MRELINEYYLEFLDNIDADEDFKKAMKYALISDGKLIRPLVFFRFLEEFDVNPQDFVNVAAAIEMIHTYSLIHDDLPDMDDDDFRRGRLTLHKQFDNATAILVGDSLLTHSFNVAIDNELLSDDIKVKIIQLMVKTSGSDRGMINGQVLDLKNENAHITQQVLENIHIQKTAMLLYLPMACACVIAGKDSELDLVFSLAQKVGLLYQVKDDYLDVYGKSLGKPLNSDADNNKTTYVNFYSKEQLEAYIYSLIDESNLIIKQLKLSNKINDLVKMFGERNK